MAAAGTAAAAGFNSVTGTDDSVSPDTYLPADLQGPAGYAYADNNLGPVPANYSPYNTPTGLPPAPTPPGLFTRIAQSLWGVKMNPDGTPVIGPDGNEVANDAPANPFAGFFSGVGSYLPNFSGLNDSIEGAGAGLNAGLKSLENGLMWTAIALGAVAVIYVASKVKRDA